MSLLTIHVALSLVGIVTGFIAMFGMVQARKPGAWTALFLLTTVLTSATGFPLPPPGFDPPRLFGIISLALMAIAIPGLYVFHLARRWRLLYVLSATAALYLNAFVGVVQTFQKIPFFQALAPTQSEPPFVIAQVALLAIFILLGVTAAKKFHPG